MKLDHIKLWCLTLIILLGTACKENKQKYSFFNFSDLKLNKLIVKGDVKEGKENGVWQIIDGRDAAILTEGSYFEGLKKGKWLYSLSKNKKSVEWKIFEDKKNNLIVNLPKDWNVIEYDNLLLAATFKTTSKIPQTKFFTILRQDTSTIHLNLTQYYIKSISELGRNYKVTSQEHFLIKSKKQNVYFSTFSVIKHGESVLLLDYIFCVSGQIYEFTYSSLNQDQELKKHIISDIVQHCYLNNQRLINPFNETEIVPVSLKFRP